MRPYATSEACEDLRCGTSKCQLQLDGLKSDSAVCETCWKKMQNGIWLWINTYRYSLLIPVGYHSMFWVGLGPAFHRMECLRLGTHTTFCSVCAFCVGLMRDQFSLILFFYLISIILYFLLRCKSSNLGPTWLPTSHRRNQRSAVTTLLDARGLCWPLLALPSEQGYCSTDD